MEQEKAGAEDGTQRPVDLRERSDLKKEKPPKGFERSDQRAEVICSPGRRRRAGEQITGARRAQRNKASPRRPGRRNDRRRIIRPEPAQVE